MIAMASAGMVEHVTDQMDRGKREQSKVSMNACKNARRPRNPDEYVSVRDCDSNVVLGELHAREIMQKWIRSLKANEKEMQMNEHNAAIGRMVSLMNKCFNSGVHLSKVNHFFPILYKETA